ncbi:unnamed protein product, partial [Cuscuta europaea]
MDSGVRKHALNGTAASNSDLVLKHITQILLEEEESIDGPLGLIALKAAEKSYYEALHDNLSSLFHIHAGRSSWNDNVNGIVDPRESESSCVTSNTNLAMSNTTE